MKTFRVEAFFPEVKPAHVAWQSCEVKATDMHTAAARGLHELRERPGVRGKRISEVALKVRCCSDGKVVPK